MAMRVFIDDTECAVPARFAGEAVVAAQSLAEGRGRLIVDVRVDGDAWTGPRLDDLAADRTSAREVRVTTAEPALVVDGTLHEAREALAAADVIQREAAALLERGERTAALEKLGEAIAIWGGVQQALVMSGELTRIDVGAILVDGVPAQRLIETLAQRLEHLRSALALDDHVGLTDTLLYELPEVVQDWRDLLAELIRIVKAKEVKAS
jgi:hypothetical protein